MTASKLLRFGTLNSTAWSGCVVYPSQDKEEQILPSWSVCASLPDSMSPDEGEALLVQLNDKLISLDLPIEGGLQALLKFLKSEASFSNTAIFYRTKDSLFVLGFGETSVLIQRNSQLKTLVSPLPSGVGVIKKGQFIPGDSLIISTGRLLDHLTFQELETLLLNSSILEAVDKINHKLEDLTQPISGVLIKFKDKDLIQEKITLDQNKPQLPVSEIEEVPSFVSNLALRLKKPFSGKLTRFKNPSSNQPEPQIYLKINQRNKFIRVVALILALILLGLFFLGGSLRIRRERQVVYTQLSQTNESLASRFTGPVTDKEKALKEIQDQKELIGLNLKLFKDNSPEKTNLEQSLESLEDLEAKVKGEVDTTANLWYDLNLIESGFKTEKIAVIQNFLFSFDASKGYLISLELDSKKFSLLKNNLVGSALLAKGNENPYLLTSGNLLELKNNELEELKIDFPPDKPLNFDLFNQNAYLLTSNQIWKLPLSGEAATKWLKESIDLTQTADMAIDGNIWIGLKNGQVLKYNQGQKQNFEIKGLERPLSEISTLKMSDDNLYLLEPQGQRIVQIEKTGNYKYQYSLVGMPAISDFALTDDEILLLSGSQIYLLPLVQTEL